MKTLSFKQILEDCIRATGWTPEQPEVAQRIPVFATLITDWTSRAYDWEFWPETMRIEQRAVVDGFAISPLNPPTEITADDGSSYSGLDGAYLQQETLVDGRYRYTSAGNDIIQFAVNQWEIIPFASSAVFTAPDNGLLYPPLEGWEAVNPTSWPIPPGLTYSADTQNEPIRSIPKGDAWDMEPIGRLDLREGVFPERPVPPLLRHALDQVSEVGDRLFCNDALLPSIPWVYFQQVPSQFATELLYDGAVTYAQGDLVYDVGSGHCYMSRVDENVGSALNVGAVWKQQPFPAFLRNAVKWGVASEFLTEESGKYQTQAKATRELERLQEKVLQGSGNGYKARRRSAY